MRNLVYAFGIVAIIDMTADGEMNMTKTMFNQTVMAGQNVFNWVLNGVSSAAHRIDDEVRYDNTPYPRPRP